MTRRMSSHSGSGVHVPDGLGGYLDAGGIKVATRIQHGHDYTDAVNNARNRITLLAVAFLMCFVVLSGRLVMITVLPSLFQTEKHLLPMRIHVYAVILWIVRVTSWRPIFHLCHWWQIRAKCGTWMKQSQAFCLSCQI